jgi:phosphoribosylamine--glycine ligase
MLTKHGPKVLEFNARFGDPETQAYLPRLENDLFELLMASAEGNLSRTEIRWSTQSCVCVVMASGGYPGDYAKGRTIRGLSDAAKLPDTKVFHAGTQKAGDSFLTVGGRVLGVTSWDNSLKRAREKAYCAVEKIKFDGAHYRRDIAAKALDVSGLAAPKA